MYKAVIATLLTNALLLSGVQATEFLDPITVTGSNLPLTPNERPLSATTITRDMIVARRPANMLDLFRLVPGIDVAEAGDINGRVFLSLRGGDPNFTLILIDGVRVNDPTDSRGGSFDLSTIDVDLVERIEIRQGALSPVYGSDALSGVINIVPRSPETSSTDVFASAGTDEWRKFGGGWSGQFGNRGNVMASVVRRVAGDVSGGDFEQNRFFGRVGMDVGIHGEVLGFAYISDFDANAFPEFSGGPLFAVLPDLETRDEQQRVFGVRFLRRMTDDWGLIVNGGWSQHEADINNPGIPPGVLPGVPPTITQTDFERLEVTVNNQLRLNERTHLGAGLNVVDEDGKSTGVIDFGFPVPANFALDRQTIGLFTEIAHQTSGGLAATVALRYDDPDSENGVWTGSAQLRYGFGSTDASLSWGSGFKLPSLFALGHPLVGNPNLAPEESDTYEFALHRPFLGGRVSGDLRLFRSVFKDLVDFDANLFTTVNRGRVRVDGAELVGRWHAHEQVSLDGSVTYSDIDVDDTGTGLRSRPEWKGYLRFSWLPPGHFSLQSTLVVVGEYLDASIPTGEVTLDGYERVDISLNHRTTDSLEFTLTIDNLLGSSYQETVGFPAPEQRVMLNVNFNFDGA